MCIGQSEQSRSVASDEHQETAETRFMDALPAYHVESNPIIRAAFEASESRPANPPLQDLSNVPSSSFKSPGGQ
jgi:hypothetical protein